MFPQLESVECLHPLCIDTVFQSIAKNFTYHELNDLRLICKDWLQMIDAIISSRMGFVFRHHPKQISDIYIEMTNSESFSGFQLQNVNFDTTPEMFNVFNHPKCHPLSDLILQDCWLNENSLLHLLREFGPKLEVLNINLDKENADQIITFPTIYENDKQHKLLQLHKMKRLSFLSILYVINWSSLAYTFPNLVELELMGLFIPSKLPNDLNLKHGAFKHLRKLNFGTSRAWNFAWDSQIWILMSMKLKLVELGILNISKATNLNCIKIFLESQKDTLKVLDITSAIKSTQQEDFNEAKSKSFIFPQLSKLIELTADDIFFKNASTLYSIPNVEILNCEFDNALKWTEIITIRKKKPAYSFPNVKKIHISSIESEYLIKMANFFPNLEYLRLDKCTDELLTILCKEFNNLKAIRVSGTILTDSGFLGISQEELRDLNGNDLVNKMLDGRPSFACIKNLEHLYIETGTDNSITDKTFRYVVLPYLLKLTRLVVFGYEISTELENDFIAAGFKPYKLKKVFRKLSEYDYVFGFIKNDRPLTVDERFDLFQEVSTMFSVNEDNTAEAEDENTTEET